MQYTAKMYTHMNSMTTKNLSLCTKVKTMSTTTRVRLKTRICLAKEVTIILDFY